MLSVAAILLIVAFICFLLAAFNVPANVNWVALGLAAWVLEVLLGAFHH